jgi:small subunit ribosomal protein S14
MKYLKEKDLKLRKNFFKIELKVLKFKFLFLQKNLSFLFHKKLLVKFLFCYKNFYFVRCVNRCIKTFKSGSIIRPFKISRIEFRRLASVGKLCGIKKSSW